MGTRSLTVVKNEYHEDIAVLYRQMDGYPDWHGTELAEFLNQFEGITNGISYRDPEAKRTANGMEDLAGMVVGNFCNKDYPGSFYLYPSGSRRSDEEYTYYIYPEDGVSGIKGILMEVVETGYHTKDKIIFTGTPAEFLEKYNTSSKYRLYADIAKFGKIKIRL